MGENVEQLECSYIVGKIAKWHEQFEKLKAVYISHLSYDLAIPLYKNK